MFSDLAREHSIRPLNRRALPLANHAGSAEYLPCGDRFKLFLVVEDGVIRQAAFEAQACSAVIAVGSVGTQMLKGLSLDKARSTTSFQLDGQLGGLPPAKRHAYLIFLEALAEALAANRAEI